MFHKILNVLFQFFLAAILLILFATSAKAIYFNLKYFGISKSGTIVDIDYSRGDGSASGKGIYINTILTDISKETIYGGSQNQYNIGDTARIRYRGLGGNIIFEVNGLKIRSKYDTWDWISPIIFLFTSFMLFKTTTIWFIPFVQKIGK